LLAVLGVDDDGRVRRKPRVGHARGPDGRRVLWCFHGAGVRIRVSGLRPVDFDFTNDPGLAVTDTWKIARHWRLAAGTLGGGTVDVPFTLSSE
jgi:hypothetical protein